MGSLEGFVFEDYVTEKVECEIKKLPFKLKNSYSFVEDIFGKYGVYIINDSSDRFLNKFGRIN